MQVQQQLLVIQKGLAFCSFNTNSADASLKQQLPFVPVYCSMPTHTVAGSHTMKVEGLPDMITVQLKDWVLELRDWTDTVSETVSTVAGTSVEVCSTWWYNTRRSLSESSSCLPVWWLALLQHSCGSSCWLIAFSNRWILGLLAWVLQKTVQSI